MTIIAAYKDNEGYWIGSDSCTFWGYVKIDCGTKLIENKNYIMGLAGLSRYKEIIKDNRYLIPEINKYKDLQDLRESIQEKIITEAKTKQIASSDQETLRHDFELLLITKIGIYKIDGNYGITKMLENFAAIGHGNDFALGSLYSSKKNKIKGKIAVTTAIKSAIKYDIYCAGNVHIKKLEIKN